MVINLPEEGAGTHWIDCSSIRPVPDHQEVFMHQERYLSIIIEVLETSPMTAREHFLELAEMNEADQHHVNNVADDELEAWGWQDIKGKRVWIGVGLRKEQKVDLLVSINSDKEEDMKQLPLLMRSLVVKDASVFEE